MIVNRNIIYISTTGYLRWFGARWFGILGVPPSNNPSHQGIQGIQTSQQVIQYVTKLDPRSLEVTKKLWKIRHVSKPSQKRSPAELPCMVYTYIIYVYIYTYIYIHIYIYIYDLNWSPDFESMNGSFLTKKSSPLKKRRTKKIAK